MTAARTSVFKRTARGRRRNRQAFSQPTGASGDGLLCRLLNRVGKTMAGTEGNKASPERDQQTKKKRASARHNMRNLNRSALHEAPLDSHPKTAAALSPRIAPAKRRKFFHRGQLPTPWLRSLIARTESSSCPQVRLWTLILPFPCHPARSGDSSRSDPAAPKD